MKDFFEFVIFQFFKSGLECQNLPDDEKIGFAFKVTGSVDFRALGNFFSIWAANVVLAEGIPHSGPLSGCLGLNCSGGGQRIRGCWAIVTNPWPLWGWPPGLGQKTHQPSQPGVAPFNGEGGHFRGEGFD